MITAADWHCASWLTAAAAGRPNQFRFEFEVPAGGVGRARACVASPGCASVLVNGELPAVNLRKIGPWVAGDEHANARHQMQDIAARVTSGKNAIGLVVGYVMTASTTVIVVVVVHPAAAGADPVVVTSVNRADSRAARPASPWARRGGWTSTGPRKRPGGRHTALPAAGWTPAVQTASLPTPLRALLSPLSAVLDEVRPVRVEALPGSDFLYTFPKSFVGTVKV